jgi:hypothetical protein
MSNTGRKVGVQIPAIGLESPKSRSGKCYNVPRRGDLQGKTKHPPPHPLGEKRVEKDLLREGVDGLAFNHIIRMGDDLLFEALGDTIPGEEPKEGTFVCGQPCTDVAFDDPDHGIGDSHLPSDLRTHLGMIDAMSMGSADIMKHRAPFDQIRVGKWGVIPPGRFPNGPAMFPHLWITAGFEEDRFPGITHNREIFGLGRCAGSGHSGAFHC